MNDTEAVRAEELFEPKIVTNNPTPAKPIAAPSEIAETEQNRFERILSRSEFKPLKAVLIHLGADSLAMNAALITTNSYQMFLEQKAGLPGHCVEANP